ncbi:MAG: glycoside hydrolase family 31 protein [Chitinophagaceae bacterium]
MIKFFSFSFLFISVSVVALSQSIPDSATILTGSTEKWYGATVVGGTLMPFNNGFSLDLNGDVKGNQAAPLLLSTDGRYAWSNSPFSFRVNEKSITIANLHDTLVIGKAGSTLASAFREASNRFFPASGKIPDPLLFTKPQYNTWIELVYNQNQEDILKYAHDIISNGFPPGVLMIDDNWAPYYGKFEFRKDRFSDPKKMVDELHSLGFKVMIWVCPFISPDSEVFRELKTKKLILLDGEGGKQLSWEKATQPTLVNWWNGYSAVMDFTNPAAIDWFSAQLQHMVTSYGIDGFKFDAGDPEFYPVGSVSFKPVSQNDHTELWGLFGLKYPLNEYRAMWKRGGQPLAERLRDKTNSWEDLQKLVPDITTSGLLGYAFACPDMIGGGEFSSFIGKDKLDQELIVRSAQSHALMPMMQFSVAPWRVLDTIHLKAVKSAVGIRETFVPLIMRLTLKAALTGEPIVRKMEYDFPNQGFADCNNQFMLGDSILVAPMDRSGTTRTILFPKGTWKGDDGTTVKGPAKKEVTVPLERLPWFRLIRRAG